jgi:hypothetical protein
LFLYTPPILIAKYFSLNIMESMPLYIFFLAFLSLSLCYFFNTKLFVNSDKFFAYVFTFFIAVVFLILPQMHFGQREHLLVIFTLPYFLFIATRLNGFKPKPLLSLSLAIFAGIGFMIKPYFFISWVMLELYYMWHLRSFRCFLRVETCVIMSLLLLYLAGVFLFYPNFIYIVVPIVTKFFYDGYSSDPWRAIISRGVVFYCSGVLVFYFLQYKDNSHKILSNVLCIGMLGFLFAYFMQQTAWIYHYLPALSYAMLSAIVLLKPFFNFFQQTKLQRVFSFLLVILALIYPIYFMIYNFNLGIFVKKTTQPLVDYMSEHMRGQSVYFLTTSIKNALPASDYSHSVLEGRFAHLPMLPGILNQLKVHPDDKSLIADEDFFMQMIADDLNIKKPAYVFIDSRKYKGFINQPFNYLSYLSKSRAFQAAWQPYHYVTTVENPVTAKIDCSVYFVPNEHALEKIKHMDFLNNKMVFIGSGAHKEVYIIRQDSAFDKVEGKTEIELSEAERSWLDHEEYGLITKKKENEAFLRGLVTRVNLMVFPAYRLDVYQRAVYSTRDDD